MFLICMFLTFCITFAKDIELLQNPVILSALAVPAFGSIISLHSDLLLVTIYTLCLLVNASTVRLY